MASSRPPPSAVQRGRSWLGPWWVGGGCVLLVLTVFLAPALGSSTFIYRDTGRLHAPMKRWMGEELAQGRFPQWNPYSGLGTPVVPNALDASQHPFATLGVLWPGSGLKLWVLLSFLAAGWGALTWARSVGLGSRAAFVAGVAFSLSGPLVSSSDNVTFLTSYATLPWVLAALQAWLGSGRPAALAGVAVSSALCLAGGDPQSWAILLAGFVPYSLAFAPGPRLASVRRALVGLVAAAVAGAPLIVPMAAWLPYAARVGGASQADRLAWNLHPARLAELAIPNLFRGGDVLDLSFPVFQAYCGNEATDSPWFLSVYLGATVLALAVTGAIADRRMRWLSLGAGVLAWVALGSYGGFGWAAGHLPLLSAFRYWEKVTVWLALIAALAAAAGVQAALGGRPRLLAGTAAIGAVLGLALAGLLAFRPSLLPGPAAPAALLAANLRAGALQAGVLLGLLAMVAVAASRRMLPRLSSFTFMAVVVADLLASNSGAYVVGPGDPPGIPPLARALEPGARVLVPFEVREDRWPELGRLRSTWEWSRRTLSASWNVPLRIGSPLDYVSLREARWSRLLAAVGDGPAVANLGLVGFDHLVVPGNPGFASRAGIVGAPEVAAEDPELPAFLVRIPHRPRAYLPETVRQVQAEQAFRFTAAGGAPGEVVIEAPVSPGWRPGPGVARVVEDVPGTTAVEVQVQAPSLLVLNDAWAPGWSATVDGVPTEILRANWVVRAVRIPAGPHRVEFRYRTPGLLAGWIIALAGWGLLATWARTRRRRAGQPSQHP